MEAREFEPMSKTLTEIFENLKNTPAAYMQAERDIREGAFNSLKKIQVGILSTFTANLFEPYFVVESARRGLLPEVYFGPFNHLEQEILQPKSDLYKASPDAVILATRLEDLFPDICYRFLTFSPDGIRKAIDEITARIRILVGGFRKNSPAPLLLFNYAQPLYAAGGLADPRLEFSQARLWQTVNVRLAEICREFPDAFIFDYARFAAEGGVRAWQDPRLWYTARVPLSTSGQLVIGKMIARYLRALFHAPCKCLVLDLDQTLWGGILGEEGTSGIALGDEYPGNVFKAFQRYLLTLHDRGILLAIASKNNENDVLDVLRNHPDCLLREEHFSAMQIHWQDKAQSLAAIARQLNLGIDALGFFDDNPVEREWVRQQLPDAQIIEVPVNPMEFPDALETSGFFDQLVLSEEDRDRSRMYRQEKMRRDFLHAEGDLESFYERLEMVATIGRVDDKTLSRVAQLIAKTNQFNLTTRRHTAAELTSILQAGAIALWLRLKDRFGDYGLVGVALATPLDKNLWKIDTFLLSCRVIGRSAEVALLSCLARNIREKGGEGLLGEYIETAKNQQVRDFFQKLGFFPIEGQKNIWQWDFLRGGISSPKYIELELDNENSIRR